MTVGSGQVKVKGSYVYGVKASFVKDFSKGSYLIPLETDRFKKIQLNVGYSVPFDTYACEVVSVISRNVLRTKGKCLTSKTFSGLYMIGYKDILPESKGKFVGKFVLHKRNNLRLKVITNPAFNIAAESVFDFEIMKEDDSSSKLVINGLTAENSEFVILIDSEEGMLIKDVSKAEGVSTFLADRDILFSKKLIVRLIFHANCVYLSTLDDFNYTVKASACFYSKPTRIDFNNEHSENAIISSLIRKDELNEVVNEIIVYKMRESLSIKAFYVEEYQNGGNCAEGQPFRTKVKYICDLSGLREPSIENVTTKGCDVKLIMSTYKLCPPSAVEQRKLKKIGNQIRCNFAKQISDSEFLQKMVEDLNSFLGHKKEDYLKLQKNCENKIKDNPFTSIFGALAVGALIGMIIKK